MGQRLSGKRDSHQCCLLLDHIGMYDNQPGTLEEDAVESVVGVTSDAPVNVAFANTTTLGGGRVSGE
jgi:hypothetical protein